MEIDCPSCGAAVAFRGRDAEARCDRCGTRVHRDGLRVVDDDRPRRRRRPPAKPTGGCGGVLTVLVVLGFLVLLGCGGIIGLVFVTGGPNWQEFRSGPGGYRVELPAPARPDMKEFAAKHGPVQPGVTFEGTVLIGRLEEYGIVYLDLEPDVRAANTDEKLLDQMTADMRDGEPEVKILTSRPVTVSGFPARELDLEVEGQRRLARIVVARTRVYTIYAGGPFTEPGEPRVRRFLDSFQVTDPRLLNAPKADPDDAPRNPWKRR